MSCQAVTSRLDRNHIERAKDNKYPDIYGDIFSQKAVIRHLSILLEVSRTILEEVKTTVSTSLDTAPPASQGSSGD